MKTQLWSLSPTSRRPAPALRRGCGPTCRWLNSVKFTESKRNIWNLGHCSPHTGFQSSHSRGLGNLVGTQRPARGSCPPGRRTSLLMKLSHLHLPPFLLTISCRLSGVLRTENGRTPQIVFAYSDKRNKLYRVACDLMFLL